MRVSADSDDPGYTAYITAGGIVRVFLDGIERDGVLMADEEAREVVMVARDERGKLRMKDGEPVKETWRGNVHIQIDPYHSGGIVPAPAKHVVNITVSPSSATSKQFADMAARTLAHAKGRL